MTLHMIGNVREARKGDERKHKGGEAHHDQKREGHTDSAVNGLAHIEAER